MIYPGDVIATNYDRHGQTYQVIDVRRDCTCGAWSTWPLRSHLGRQRLPHVHVVALDDRGERNWWSGLLERDGRLIESGRMWFGTDRIHPEVFLFERAEQASLF